MTLLEVAGTLLLVAMVAGVVAVVALPIMLAMAVVGAVVKVALLILIAPIRLLGWLMGAGLAVVGFLLEGSLLTGAAALLIVVGLLPLAPFLLLGLLLVLLVRSSRRSAAPAART
ncbi:MAG TPA: hypothetical protein VFG08_06385 [Candidatus Polarisedimenticolia bacterium]|nr:hypothetical protein [Candidatus Polarisedimenticolia bacterium]